MVRALAVAWCTVAGCQGTPADQQSLPDAPLRGPSLATVAMGQSVDLAAPLDSTALALIAVLTNPDLAALRQREGIAEAQVFAAGLYPDPTFSAGFDVPLHGVGLVTALAASLGLDLAGLARRNSATREARSRLDSVRLDIAWAEWLTGEQARLLAVRVTYLEQKKSLATQLRQLTAEEFARTWRAVSRGDLPASALEPRRLADTDASDRDRTVEHELQAARLDLNRLLGIDPSERLRIAEPRPSATHVLPANELFGLAMDARADLVGQRAAYAGALAAIETAQLGRYPLPAIGVNFARDTGAIKTLGPAVSLTLPLWNRGRGDEAVAQASRAQLHAEYLARLETVRADIASAHSALEIAQKQLADVRQDIAPLAPQVEASARAAQRGDLASNVMTASRLALLDKQIVAIGLSQSVAELQVALELATGQPLENF